jgi:hypothetical protein
MSSAQPNNSGTYMTLLSILVLGLFLGMRHATDAYRKKDRRHHHHLTSEADDESPD